MKKVSSDEKKLSLEAFDVSKISDPICLSKLKGGECLSSLDGWGTNDNGTYRDCTGDFDNGTTVQYCGMSDDDFYNHGWTGCP